MNTPCPLERPFSMRGSKSGKHVERIVGRLDPNRNYRHIFDPFVGAGGIALRLVEMYPAARHYWGDGNLGIAAFWKTLLSLDGAAMLRIGHAHASTGHPEPHVTVESWREFRDEYNYWKKKSRPDSLLAGAFLHLMAHAMNALYRENRSGGCNTTRTDRPKRIKWDAIERLAEVLPRHVEFLDGQYRDVLLRAVMKIPQDTLVFLDPPYFDKFDMYVEGGFDHEEFSEVALMLAKAGHSVLLTNSEECLALPAYQDPIWEVTYSDVTYTGSAKVKGRRSNTEVILGANLIS